MRANLHPAPSGIAPVSQGGNNGKTLSSDTPHRSIFSLSFLPPYMIVVSGPDHPSCSLPAHPVLPPIFPCVRRPVCVGVCVRLGFDSKYLSLFPAFCLPAFSSPHRPVVRLSSHQHHRQLHLCHFPVSPFFRLFSFRHNHAQARRVCLPIYHPEAGPHHAHRAWVAIIVACLCARCALLPSQFGLHTPRLSLRVQ